MEITFDQQAAHSLAGLMFTSRHRGALDKEFQEWYVKSMGENLFAKYGGQKVVVHWEIFTH